MKARFGERPQDETKFNTSDLASLHAHTRTGNQRTSNSPTLQLILKKDGVSHSFRSRHQLPRISVATESSYGNDAEGKSPLIVPSLPLSFFPHLLSDLFLHSYFSPFNMRYIRFLKPPKIQGNVITALITITSDLGDSFYPVEALLAAAIHSANPLDEIYIRRNLKWLPGMRSLPISLDISGCDIDWPVKLHVTQRSMPRSDHFEEHQSGVEQPNIISAWSDVLDPSQGIMEATRTVERRLTPLSGRTISIWEETGESIARHIWYGT
jgi:hypothetical protein